MVERDMGLNNTVNLEGDLTLSAINVPHLPESMIPLESPDLKQFKASDDYIFPRVRSEITAITQDLNLRYDVKLKPEEPPRGVAADIAIACQRLAGVLRKAPDIIARELAAELESQKSVDGMESFIKKITAEKGYINFELDAQNLGSEILTEIENDGENYGRQNIGDGKTVVIDCSSPNVAKFMSVGHLRSTVIGESLARIYKAGGYKVIRDNHLGDWGTQFGMLGRAHELWYDEIKAEGGSEIQTLYQLYVKINEEVEKEKGSNAEKESVLATEGREWFKRLEQGDPKAMELLKWATTESLAEFQHIYDKLGVNFEYMMGESYYIGMVPQLIDFMMKKGVATQDEKGAIVVEFDDEKKNRLVVQKSDGSSLYSTRDLATIIARKKWFNPDKILYVVGGDQREYFEQVFEAFRKLEDDKDQPTHLEHVSFGMISLPEGKMSTRKGRVVFLGDVLDEGIERAEAKLRSSDRDLPDEEIEATAQQIGVGSVIYFDLGHARERNIKFNWDEALSMEGNSAPYIQYSHARAESVLRKAEEQEIAIDRDVVPTIELVSEVALIKHLGKFPEAISKSLNLNEPSVVGEYVYRTADLFNQFYREAPLVVEKDADKRNSRLRLTQATAQVLRNGLNLLSIKTPARM